MVNFALQNLAVLRFLSLQLTHKTIPRAISLVWC